MRSEGEGMLGNGEESLKSLGTCLGEESKGGGSKSRDTQRVLDTLRGEEGVNYTC